MRLLVTAGNTQAPIDRVRAVTNIFTGRTGAGIALAARAAGHEVTLLTSHPEVLGAESRCRVKQYRTYDDLAALLESEVRSGAYDAIVHAAAVNDYRTVGVYRWPAGAPEPEPVDSTGKVKSTEPEIWLRLVPTAKLVDKFRSEWGFRGVLVKFKLEVGVDDATLLAIAEASRRHSEADLMVANTLEGSNEWAYIGPLSGSYVKVTRAELPTRLLEAIGERTNG